MWGIKMEKEMFILNSFELNEEKNLIIFYGRAIEEIAIGDTLKYCMQKDCVKNYIICEIISYGKKIDILGEGMTGAILVRGEMQMFICNSVLTM